MSDPYVAEIRIFAGNFAPQGWALCNGQLMPISQNTALFSLLGTTYGGDGIRTFALPNLQGCVPVNFGQGPGLSDYVLGESTGVPNVTLQQTQMPTHGHTLQAHPGPANNTQPSGNSLARPTNTSIYSNALPNESMGAAAISVTGSSQPHDNMQPYLVLNFIIALQGIFPPRN